MVGPCIDARFLVSISVPLSDYTTIRRDGNKRLKVYVDRSSLCKEVVLKTCFLIILRFRGINGFTQLMVYRGLVLVSCFGSFRFYSHMKKLFKRYLNFVFRSGDWTNVQLIVECYSKSRRIS